MTDEKILRALAREYWLCAQHPHNAERRELHRAVNDLRMIRPVVLVDELPWVELNTEGELTLQCRDPYLRQVECFFRQQLYKFQRLRADMILRPYFPVDKVVHSTGIGLRIEENTQATETGNHIISHEYHDMLQSDADLERLHPAVVTYDAEETDRRYQLVGELFGDLLPVKKVGTDHVTMHPWDDISRARGVTPLLMSLAEDPDFSHRVIQKVSALTADSNRQYLNLGLYDSDPLSLHCTPILTDALHPEQDNRTFQNLWGRGTAQIFASVSKAMHEEFDIAYMKETLGSCGLVYYGCCEPLDKKIDMVEQIPNLRKIGMTPWADVQVGAEAIGKKYVLSAKPNPSSVCTGTLDHHTLRKELGNILDACAKNGCACDIVLKDISSCGHRPQNLFEWVEIAMDMVQHF